MVGNTNFIQKVWAEDSVRSFITGLSTPNAANQWRGPMTCDETEHNRLVRCMCVLSCRVRFLANFLQIATPRTKRRARISVTSMTRKMGMPTRSGGNAKPTAMTVITQEHLPELDTVT